MEERNEYKFPKSEKLCLKKDIDELFKKGKSLNKGHLKVKYLVREPGNQQERAKVLIIVPKKFIRKAFQRNRLKRQLREIYRLNKSSLLNVLEEKDISITIAIISFYTKLVSYKEIESELLFLLKEVSKKNQKKVGV